MEMKLYGPHTLAIPVSFDSQAGRYTCGDVSYRTSTVGEVHRILLCGYDMERMLFPYVGASVGYWNHLLDGRLLIRLNPSLCSSLLHVFLCVDMVTRRDATFWHFMILLAGAVTASLFSNYRCNRVRANHKVWMAEQKCSKSISF